jgi:hypothetical protein
MKILTTLFLSLTLIPSLRAQIPTQTTHPDPSTFGTDANPNCSLAHDADWYKAASTTMVITCTKREKEKEQAAKAATFGDDAHPNCSLYHDPDWVKAATGKMIATCAKGEEARLAAQQAADATDDAARAADRLKFLRANHCPQYVWVGTSSRCAELILGRPDHTNTDALGDDQWVYPHMNVYINKRGRVSDIQTSY